MLSTIIFLSILIIFLSLMLSIDVQILFDIDNNNLQVIIKLYKIKIFTIVIDILGLHYRINKSKKVKSLKFFLPKEQEYFLKQIKSSVLDKLYYDEINFFSSVYTLDPAITANIVGVINAICGVLKNLFEIKNNDLSVNYFNTAGYVNKNNKLYLNIKVYFTIFDMVFAVILSFYKRGKYVKQKK